jgi:hypothetical protein
MQAVEQGGRQAAVDFDTVGSRCNIGAQGFRPGDHRPVASKIG